MAEKKRHPEVPGCVARLTDDAVEDLRALFKTDPQIVRWAFKKMLQIERDPSAGHPLLGSLIGYRKIIFGDRDWRVVWRVAQDEAGDFRVEVAEVWAVGYRKDSEVYAEINQRVADADSSPKTKALTEVVELFAKQARDLTATPEPETPEPVPAWLTKALLHVVGLPATTVKELNLEQADKVWNDYTSGAGPET
ncbi:type II toxin-antitoxin system RelE/ParE family toxin [Solicola gregarius]|uniref:Type II toxin-antitoxin system RelE/ParE family toxin n=1 Tax=Solicola gregarius TaxID=2908642 RepID=A0AA46THW1_9ACTN|nr:type II toxin-antitoxin system RelE/ParE family toxin [Solicola gregarius]UYM05117.1 type II toxin-antitoxin system RelE/ParE family toxin [Solicola gregarius]